jgi:hypothetical protein
MFPLLERGLGIQVNPFNTIYAGQGDTRHER